ncbi:GntR family transcriptional regulator [Acetobacterium wieringae]|uniref:GntR family transcriptional regulator n=1 Tax=Acetobacterium wieringae TaxID=52694 RepID=A0ABY6HG10_9FIRM|nr:GntR family transcriptional regulator [Acetobacterium wieringae]UYO63477.1 GntR family transcriptional regulator [Acetobacterium wieringae]VUZ26177.1 HTH-type transcriptional regulator LutR [Acetobacterium wieringae]
MWDDKKGLSLDISSCKPLREIVFETIRCAIITGELQPGQRLMEVQLAEQMGVSRTPVRESIRKLELEGLVKMVPRKGVYVTPMSVNDLKEMMEIRRALEGLAAELAAMNATKEEISRLYEANELFGESALHNDEEGIIKHDMQIHETIYTASKNVKLQAMINSLREQMQRFRAEYVHRIEDKTPLVNQHMEIIRQIEKGECRKANLAACDHIYTTGDSMLGLLKKND